MRVLTGAELADAERFIAQAACTALGASCLRSRCGSVIVSGGDVIGCGVNSPPGGCAPSTCVKDSIPKDFRSDRTCCVHAEQRAVMDALRSNSSRVPGSRLYFVRLDEAGGVKPSGDPYCTICSKAVLDAGVAEFVLVHSSGVTVYDTTEYNDLSFRYGRREAARVLTEADVPDAGGGNLHAILGVWGEMRSMRQDDGLLTCARPGCTELINPGDPYYDCAYGSGAVHAWCADN